MSTEFQILNVNMKEYEYSRFMMVTQISYFQILYIF